MPTNTKVNSNWMCRVVTGFVLLMAMQNFVFAQQKTNSPDLKRQAFKDLDQLKDHYKSIALQIWNFAELGYKEVNSSALLQEELKKQGFQVEAGVAGIPTAFSASFGSGSPVIGILAEYDALPGLSQQAIPEKKSR